VPSLVTQYKHHAQEEEDIEDVAEDQELEGQVQNSIVTHRPKRNIRKPTRFSDMVVDYALPVEVIEDSVPYTFRAKLSSESEL